MNRTEFTSDTKLLEIQVGDDLIRIPANYVRFGNQRKTPVTDQLDLVYSFPELSGYSQARKSVFNTSGNESSLVHVSLRQRKLSFDMSNRLTPIYSQLFEGSPRAGPAGLIFQPLRTGSGYDGEILAIGNNNGRKWVARCQTPQSNVRPICIRDIFVGRSISALHSFPHHMLESWIEIENKTTEFLKTKIN